MKGLKQQKLLKTIETINSMTANINALEARIDLSKNLGLETKGDELLLKVYQQNLDDLSKKVKDVDQKNFISSISTYGQNKVVDDVLLKITRSAVDVSASAVESSGKFIETVGVSVVDTTAMIVKTGLKGFNNLTSLTSNAFRKSSNTIIEKGGDSLKSVLKLFEK